MYVPRSIKAGADFYLLQETGKPQSLIGGWTDYDVAYVARGIFIFHACYS